MRLRSVFAVAVAGLVALALAACSPGEDEPTASPTVASPTPTEVATTPSPTATPSPTPTLTQEEVHVAEATETLKQYIATSVRIANNGGQGAAELDPFLGTEQLLNDYSTIWASMRENGTYTVGTTEVSDVSLISYVAEATGGPTVTLRYCADVSQVTQFDAAGTAFPAPAQPRNVGLNTMQRGPDSSWRVLEERPSGEAC